VDASGYDVFGRKWTAREPDGGWTLIGSMIFKKRKRGKRRKTFLPKGIDGEKGVGSLEIWRKEKFPVSC
jgi:hypothetical protein